jgi:hypothetical protein
MILELKFLSNYLYFFVIQLQEIYYNINNIIILNNQNFSALDIIVFVIGFIMFTIAIVNISAILTYSVNAGKEALKKLGIAITGLGTAASVYTGGKEVYKDFKKFQEDRNKSTNTTPSNKSTNTTPSGSSNTTPSDSGSSNNNNSPKKA